MKAISNFADRKPLFFVLMLLLFWILVGAFAIPPIAHLAGLPVTNELPQSAGTLIATSVMLLLAHRLGWFDAIGINHFGTRSVWAITLFIGLYLTIANIYAFFGDIHLDPVRLIATPETRTIMSHQIVVGFVEETLFRGVLLYTLVRAWGSTRAGILRAILVQAVLFGLPHFLQVFAGNLPLSSLFNVFACMGMATWLGILVALTGTLWPAILLHTVSNAVPLTVALTVSWLEPLPLGYLRGMLFDLPLILMGIWVVLNMRDRNIWSPSPLT